MALFLGYRDAGTVLLSKCEAERQRVANLKEQHNPTPIFGGVTLAKRRPRRSWMDEEKEGDKDEADEFLVDKDKVCAKRPSGRAAWLEQGLVLAGKGTISAGTIYDIITSKNFLEGVSEPDGIIMRKLLYTNLHVFPHARQQKYLQSNECGFKSFPNEVSTADSSHRNDGSGDEDSQDGRRNRSRSQRRRRRSRSASGQAGADETKFHIGQRVRRRDKGKEWGIGYVLSLDPLKITVKDDPKDIIGFRFKHVEPLPEVALPQEAGKLSKHANRAAKAFAAGVWRSRSRSGGRRTEGVGAPPALLPGEDQDPRMSQPGAMDAFL